jgi:hypothetical protein
MTKTGTNTDQDDPAKAEKPARKQWRKPEFTRLNAALAEVGINATTDGIFTFS